MKLLKNIYVLLIIKTSELNSVIFKKIILANNELNSICQIKFIPDVVPGNCLGSRLKRYWKKNTENRVGGARPKNTGFLIRLCVCVFGCLLVLKLAREQVATMPTCRPSYMGNSGIQTASA